MISSIYYFKLKQFTGMSFENIGLSLTKSNNIFYHFLNLFIMGNLLYTIAVILIIIWAIGFLGFHAGGLIHAVLVIGIILFLFQIISGRKTL
jgi:hypothetical protein